MHQARPLDEIATIFFIDVAVIIVVARFMGVLAKRLRQPAVVGEIIGGILLGPTLLGAFPGDLTTRLFPTDVVPHLKVVAQLGLIIFMFIVGLELDVALIRGKERMAALISISSIILPFGLGFGLAALVYHSHALVKGDRVEFISFALFIGAAMSVTAFPVLARILAERGIHRTALGAIALACAAVDDILAWSLLAVVLAVVNSTGIWDLPVTVVESLGFVAFMFIVVKPRLEFLVRRREHVGRLAPDILGIVLLGILLSSFVTSKIGIHAIFGAFLFGVIMPRVGAAELTADILEQLENVTVLLLLPIFFIVTGLDVNVRGIGLSGLGEFGLIMFVACFGKFVGASTAARLQGMSSRRAAAVGILMNTRGLTELVILNVGREAGVLDDRLFTLLVLMAITTTVMAEPLLRVVYPDRWLQHDIAEAERSTVGDQAGYRLLVPVGDAAHHSQLADVALAVAAGSRPSELVLVRFSRLTRRMEVGSGLGTELGDMAASLAQLNELCERAASQQVQCVTMTNFSSDLTRDVIARATNLEVDLVMLGWQGQAVPEPDRAGFVGRVLEGAQCDVAVFSTSNGGISTGPERAIIVLTGEDEHDVAALELAIRMGRGSGAELVLLERVAEELSSRARRRLAAVADQLRRVGVRCSGLAAATSADDVAERARGVGLLVSGAGRLATAAVDGGVDLRLGEIDVPAVVVRAATNVESRRVEDLIERLGLEPVAPDS